MRRRRAGLGAVDDDRVAVHAAQIHAGLGDDHAGRRVGRLRPAVGSVVGLFLVVAGTDQDPVAAMRRGHRALDRLVLTSHAVIGRQPAAPGAPAAEATAHHEHEQTTENLGASLPSLSSWAALRPASDPTRRDPTRTAPRRSRRRRRPESPPPPRPGSRRFRAADVRDGPAHPRSRGHSARPGARCRPRSPGSCRCRSAPPGRPGPPRVGRRGARRAHRAASAQFRARRHPLASSGTRRTSSIASCSSPARVTDEVSSTGRVRSEPARPRLAGRGGGLSDRPGRPSTAPGSAAARPAADRAAAVRARPSRGWRRGLSRPAG